MATLARRALTCLPSLLLMHAPAAQSPSPPPIRVLLRARSGGSDRLTPLRYIGGFETKTLLYETLVKRGPDGHVAPGLASRWSWDELGTTCLFELREGATYHDGKPVTAESVRVHFQRWVGLPEHDWLACNRHITGITTSGDRIVRVHLDQPYALLADLCAINPCAIVGPGARDWEGEWKQPMGTGPFRFVAEREAGKGWLLERVEPGGCRLEIGFAPRGRDATPIDALKSGTADAFVGGWDEDLPAAALDELARDPRFVVQEAPGSSVAYVSFHLADGPTADPAIRQRIARAIDKKQLIALVEGGRADVCNAWAAPAVAFWPRSNKAAEPPMPVVADLPLLRIATGRLDSRAARIAGVLKDQLVRAGFQVEMLTPAAARSPAAGAEGEGVESASGDERKAAKRALRELADRADLRIEITHGVPYDPHQSLAARWGPVPDKNADQPRPRGGVDLRLQALVAAAMATADEIACTPIYAEIQALMDREVLLVPLYVPHRIALRRADVEGIVLDLDCYRVDLSGLHRVEATR